MTTMTQEEELEKNLIAYVNSEYVRQGEAKLSIFDKGVLYGDGVFDTWCCWNGYIFKLDEKIDRLFRSLRFLQIDISQSKAEIHKIIVKVVETNGAKNQYIKALVTRGVGPRPLLSPVGCIPSVVVFSRPYLWLVEPGKEAQAIKTRITNIRRIPPQCLDPKAKCINYENQILAKIEAMNSGADEAIMLDVDGFVNEGPAYNIFIVIKGKLYTPPAVNMLVGATMETVFEIAEQEGIEVKEVQLVPYDLYNADEVFFTSTAGGIIPVGEVDSRKISSGKIGPVTKKVRDQYFDMLEKGVHGTPVSTQ